MGEARAWFRFAALTAWIFFVVGHTASAEILLSIDLGNSWDPLVGANPFFVSPSETRFSEITASSNVFATPFSGAVRLKVNCCLDALTRQPVTVSGMVLTVTPNVCREQLQGRVVFEGLEPGQERPVVRPPVPPVPPGDLVGIVGPFCPTAPDTTVNVTPQTAGRAFLRMSADSTATPGTVIATLIADSNVGTPTTKDIFVSVVPSSWPADGPAPACPPPLTLVSLASITPAPYAWKRANLAKTSYAVGLAFNPMSLAAGAGFTSKVGPASTTGPLPPTVTSVTFTNTGSRSVALRTVDSRQCGATGQQVVVAAGQTKSISFSATSTTTLVFAKSTCQALVDWFDCWGGSALGLDDIVVLSEGPFWPLFGGRKVDIATVGDWAALAMAVGRTF